MKEIFELIVNTKVREDNFIKYYLEFESYTIEYSVHLN